MAERKNKGPFRIEQRGPFEGELQFFQRNPGVAGMATADDKVILNPFSQNSPEQQQQVLLNESARVFMRVNKIRPDFELTPEQKKTFKSYSPDIQDKRETIAARLLSNDLSAGKPTKKQLEFKAKLHEQMFGASL